MEEKELTKLGPKMDKSYTGSSGQTIEVRLEFPHSFEVEILREIPGAEADLRYFPLARYHSCDGLLLRITPESTPPWSGLFAALPSGSYRSGVYSCPDRNNLCIVSNGAGYIFDVRDPEGYQEISLSPVLDVLPALDAGLLIFVNFTDVLAWSCLGKQWLSERVSFDGISNLQIDGGILRGVAWSPTDNEHHFALNLATGAVRQS